MEEAAVAVAIVAGDEEEGTKIVNVEDYMYK